MKNKEDYRLGLDIDGVLCDFTTGVLNRAKMLGLAEHFPEKREDVTHWNISDKFAEVMDGMWENYDFWLDLQPLVKHVPFKPHCYITSRFIPAKITKQWLDIHKFPEAPVISVDHPSKKITYIQEMELDLFVDDLYSTVRQLREAGINSVLFSAPYHVGHKEECEGLPTIKSLNEVWEYLG